MIQNFLRCKVNSPMNDYILMFMFPPYITSTYFMPNVNDVFSNISMTSVVAMRAHPLVYLLVCLLLVDPVTSQRVAGALLGGLVGHQVSCLIPFF